MRTLRLAAPRMKNMPASASPEFEVASIKPAKSGIQGKGNGIRGLQFSTANNSAVADLAFLLQTIMLDRPVVDQTVRSGKWDCTPKWTPDDDDLFAAMQKQLGLKLISAKAPGDVLAIERVQRPKAN